MYNYNHNYSLPMLVYVMQVNRI